MTTLGYDGIDLDWEDSVNLDDLVSLAQALRASKPSILLTYPAGAINGNFDGRPAHDDTGGVARSLQRADLLSVDGICRTNGYGGLIAGALRRAGSRPVRRARATR